MIRRSTSFCFASMLASALLAGTLLMTPTAPARAASFAYVGNSTNANIAVIRPTTPSSRPSLTRPFPWISRSRPTVRAATS